MKQFFIAAFILATVISCKEKSTLEQLIPLPSQVERLEGSFEITKETVIVNGGDSATEKTAQYFSNFLKSATGFNLKVVAPQDKPAKNFIVLEISSANNEMSQEGYQLTILKEGISLIAGSDAGLFYGIQTIRQLLPQEIESSTIQSLKWEIPAVNISDKPLYAYRGSMLDVSRHFFNVADVKKYIDYLAYYKMNVFHLHLTDDQGWRIEIKSWPNLTAIGGQKEVGEGMGGFYTQDNYKEIVQYAADRHITIIPEIDMPGHTNAALASYATLNCNDFATQLYTGTEVGFSSLCTQKEITYQFIEDVIRELSAITPGPYIHIGGDESHVTKKEDYIPFMERVQGIVRKYNKTPIGWDEIATSKVLPGTLAQYWADASNSKAAVQQGAKIIMAPARKAYLDMQYDSTTTLGLHWAGYVEVDSAYSWDPATLENGIGFNNIIGIEAPLWTETIDNLKDLQYLTFPRLAGYAEIGWTPTNFRNWETYKLRLAEHSKRWDKMNINYYRSPKVYPKD